MTALLLLMSIRELVDSWLEKSKDVVVNANGVSISIVSSLKQLPRSGKAVRIDHYGLGLPKRSVYDHVVSLGANADVFGKYIPVFNSELVAKLIAFHEFNEVVVGDVPDFTPESLAKHTYKPVEMKLSLERKADDLISAGLGGDVKLAFDDAHTILHAKSGREYEVFKMFDVSDPIIGIWRYLHLYKGKINLEPFLEAMTDFFTNPKVIPLCVDVEVRKFVSCLQDKANARLYFKKGISAFGEFYDGRISLADVKLLLEERKIHVV